MVAADILPILRRWQAVLVGLDDALEPLRSATGIAPECPINAAIYAAIGLCNEWAAQRIGCEVSALEWWWLENDFGERGHEAGSADGASFPPRPMRTLADYADLLAWEVA
jgi:hypothetical protein